jgi:hypothetical protein
MTLLMMLYAVGGRFSEADGGRSDVAAGSVAALMAI